MSSVSLVRVSKSFALTTAATLAREIATWPAAEPAGDGSHVRALDGVTLDIADGEAMAVLGPSGCGKSTLLRVIAGLEPPDAGSVLFDGEDVTEVPAQRRGVGMVFQSYALYPNMDSRRNLGFFFRMHRREEEAPERVAGVCEIMGAGFRDLLHRRPNELSGGQQQRVAIGRCVIREPRVFLFDEPLSNLDAKLRAHTRVEIKRLIRRFGITSVYVTHDQTEAIAIADRIAVMRRGRVEQVGRYRDLYDAPANTFVAGFFGTPPMNLLDGVIDRAGARFVLTPPGFDASTVYAQDGGAAVMSLPLPPRFEHALPAGTPVTLGLRPGAIRLAGADEAGIDVRVVVAEPLVAERQQLVRCALGPPRAPLAELAARIAGTERIAPGTPLRLTFDPADGHLFDRDGRRR